MKKERILIYTTQLMSSGGIESHLLEFCNQLSTNKQQLYLVVLNTNINSKTEDLYKKYCYRVLFCKSKYPYLRLLWLTFIGLKFMFKHFDALYTNGQGSSILYFSILLRKYRTWVHHHHTSGDLMDQATWNKNYLKSLNKAHVVIACSSRNANDMQQVIHRPIITIPCFSRKIILSKKKAPNNNIVHFGYYGRLIPEKGIDIISRLSEDEDIKNVEFHIWGAGEAYPLSFFKNHRFVNYHGPFNGTDELKTVLQSIDAFLLLSTHPEGLPISLLEVMSAGIPWLATDRGGISDIACDFTTTRLISGIEDYNEVKRAIISLAADIRAGQISSASQIDLYNKKFAANELISQWRSVLGIKQAFTY